MKLVLRVSSGRREPVGGTHDLIVAGASAAGVAAAVAAAREGLRVILVEETPTLGGLLSNGLSAIDLPFAGCSTGIFEEFRQRVRQHYRDTLSQDPAWRHQFYGSLGLRWEPHVAHQVLAAILAEAGAVEILLQHRVSRVLKNGRAVTGVVITDLAGGGEKVLEAPVTVDATYTGDLLPLADAPFEISPEPAGCAMLLTWQDSGPTSEDAILLPNRKYCTRRPPQLPFAVDYVLGDQTRRGEIRQECLKRARESLPEVVLCEDEYPGGGNAPYLLWLEETRRPRGIGRFTPPAGAGRDPVVADSVASGIAGVPFQVPYGALLPQSVDGLLSAVAVSAEPAASALLGNEPLRMSLGQAAGLAAALSVRSGCQPAQLDAGRLQQQLLRRGGALYFYKDLQPSHPQFRAIQRLSQAGVVQGYEDFTFRPEAHLTRGDLSRLLVGECGRRRAGSFWSRLFGHFGREPGPPADSAPEELARQGDLVQWSTAVLGKWVLENDALRRVAAEPDSPLPRGKACQIVEQL